MNIGCWPSKKVMISHFGWRWEKMPRLNRWIFLGMWTTEDSEVYQEQAGKSKDGEVKLKPYFSRRASQSTCNTNKNKNLNKDKDKGNKKQKTRKNQ